jgi:hypothetical protein
MTVASQLGQGIVLSACAVAMGIALFIVALQEDSTRGEREPLRTVSTPGWFGPIWDYYDRNAAVTPAFDFAALYAGETSRAGSSRR